VLGSGAALNDELYIVAFGTFNVASFNGSGLDDNTVNISKLNATGTRSAATALRGDNTFADITPTEISDQANTSTGYMMMPVGTTGQRPGTPAAGMFRMNTSTGNPEWYDTVSTSWIPFSYAPPYDIEYLVIAGGGGGGVYASGAGAGGYLTNNGGSALSISPGNQYPIVIGSGGPGRTSLSAGGGTSGSNTTAFSLTAIGGGAGVNNGNGTSGGSGSGGGYDGTGGSGTSGQGNAGGNGVQDGGVNAYLGGGGGGAGAVGINATLSGYQAGGGGAGKNTQSTWASATSTGVGGYYAGGGGSGVPKNGPYVAGQQPGAGGSGGGTAGTSGDSRPADATANTGSGAGSAGYNHTTGYASLFAILERRVQLVARSLLPAATPTTPSLRPAHSRHKESI
jgi:hypothetical protein